MSFRKVGWGREHRKGASPAGPNLPPVILSGRLEVWKLYIKRPHSWRRGSDGERGSILPDISRARCS